MSDIVPFNFQGTEVRTLLIDDEPWWVARDVLTSLGLANATEALRSLDLDEFRDHELVDSLGRRQPNARIINEPGLYALILRSKKPQAKAFKRWVTHEVLPQIRKTGQYAVTADPPDELELAERYVVAIKEKRAALALAAELKAERDALAPAAHSWDVLASARGDFSVAEAAAILNRDENISTGRDRLFRDLDKLRWIYRSRGSGKWHAYQTAIDNGRLVARAQGFDHPRTGERMVDAPQVRVTVKGVHDLHRRLGGDGPIGQFIAEAPDEDGPAGSQLALILDEAS